MKLNSTENMHGILQGFSTLTEQASNGCRTALHNGTLFCAYLGEGHKVMYIIKPPYANWGEPIALEYLGAGGHYAVGPYAAGGENPSMVGYVTTGGAIPSLVSFNNTLWLVYTDENGITRFRTWSESHATFVSAQQQALNIEHSATFAQLNNVLYMFYKLHGGSNIYCTSTSDMEHWSKPLLIKKDGPHTITTSLSPAAIAYQGLIHLFYKDQKGGFFLLKSDGEYWTSPIAFINADYPHSPGITVHNGLLKLGFCSLSNAPSTALYQYSYDGNALSPVVASTQLNAGGSPALSSQDGKLIATYLESDPDR